MTMRHPFIALLLCFPVLVVISAAPALAQTAGPVSPVVVVSGETLVKVAPDQAWVTVALETRDTKAPEARRLGAAVMTTVIAVLRQAGLDSDAIQTVGFSLQPDYEYTNGRQRMKGFVVANQLQVRIDDIARVADTLDAVGGLTVPASSNITIAGLRFDVKHRAGVEREALKGAVEDAMARARSMASGAGLSLGRTLRIEEAGGQVMPRFSAQPAMLARGGMDAAVPTPIAPGDIEIRAVVSVTVEIK